MHIDASLYSIYPISAHKYVCSNHLIMMIVMLTVLGKVGMGHLDTYILIFQ